MHAFCIVFDHFIKSREIKFERKVAEEKILFCENRGNTADCATSPSLIVLLLANRQTGRDYIEVSQRQERKCISHKTRLGKVKDAFFFHEKRNI